MLVNLQWSAPASQQMSLPEQALPQATVLGLLSCRGPSRQHPLHMATLRLQMQLKQLCRQLTPLHLLGQETLLGQEALLLPQLQRRGPQTSGISQKPHQWQRQGMSR